MSSERMIAKGRSNPLAAVVDALPVTALVIGLAMWWLGWPSTANSDGEIPPLAIVPADSAEQLDAVFTQAGYLWPTQEVPPITIEAFPPDLDEVDPELRKSLFFRALLPMVLAENARIEAQRQRLFLALGDSLPEPRRVTILGRLAAEYDVEGEPLAPETVQALKRRVDTVPPALALAQAAKESGWGTSRFAREGNNLFGEWTWNPDIGLVPRDRAEDADHFVRVFANPRLSVRSYLNNLNSHSAYTRFRTLRARAHAEGRVMDPTVMTAGLEQYSQRGWDYVYEVRAMIESEQLHRLAANARLSDDSSRIAMR